MFFELDKQIRSLDDYQWLNAEGRISVPEPVWSEIKSRFERDVVRDYLAHLIKKHDIPFPEKKFSEIEELQNFKRLIGSDYEVLTEPWTHQNLPVSIDTRFLGGYVLIKPDFSGKSISDMFMREQRFKAKTRRTRNYLTGFEAWGRIRETGIIPTGNYGLITGCFSSPSLNDEAFMYGLRMTGSTVTQFRPASAKALYDFFNAKNVLDLSAGWGDRLVGFLASSAESYIGIDPNSALHEPYQKIVDFCKAENKRARFICAPAEDVDFESLQYDFVFTSPPYFDVEVYSDEETQSLKRYPKLESWKNDFLFKMLEKCFKGLKDNGRLAINICDSPVSRFHICDELIKFMSSIGATYEGTVGYHITVRPHPGDAHKGYQTHKAEPIFIWSKGDAPSPVWKKENFFGL